MAELNSYVHVRDEHGANHVFGPGSTVPKWAREKITNPEVWEGGSEESGSEHETATEPPRSGKGSGDKAWADYAKALGIEVADGAKKSDIIPLVDARNGAGTDTGTDSGSTEDTIPGEDADVAAWIAYAATSGLEIDADDDATVEEIIKVLDANDVKTK